MLLLACLPVLFLNLNQPSYGLNAKENQNLTLDVDGDGEFDALTDGLLIIRSMFGLSGDALVVGVVGQDAQFSSSDEIEQRLALLGDELDIDENGQIDALTDGLLSLRFLFGLSGTTLVDNVVASGANRSGSDEIESYLSDLTTFNINFTSKNFFSVPENQKTVGIISANDVDGGALTYSIVSSTDNNLVINAITGEMFFISAPDYEAKRSYRVVVSATDGENTTIKGIQIAVTNVDDVAAVFTSSPNFSVKENTSLVGTVIASDIDSSNLEFSVSGNELAIENSGLLTFSEAPDFEFRNEYKAIITVTDGINPAYQNIIITITDENDVAPTILSDSSFAPIVAPGKPTLVGNVDARDADSEVLIYTITGSDLSIDSNGGITFKNEPAYGTEITFDAIVSVTDGVFSVDQNILVDPLYDFDGDGSPDHIDPDDDNDGVFDDVDAFPLDSNESEDTDGDGVGNNQDTDDDNDGEPDVTDPFPLDPGNVFDSDGDGVVDREDVSPNDPTIIKAIQFNLADSRSIGLGEALIDNSDSISSFFNNLSEKNGNTQKVSLDSLTNIINWDADGDEIRDAIMSSETLFVAGANITPDGKFLYLLTSQHLQNRTQGLDNEICSIYRISIQDNSYSCLLNVSDGDIEPKVLVPSLQNDFARRGISFRSDGAAVMQGFDSNRELPDGYEGGTNSTIAYFMSSDGKLTRLPAGEDFFVVGVAWLADEFIAVAEYPMISGNGENPRAGEERLVIIDSVTLEPIKYVNAPNIWGPIVKANNNIYWSGGGALSGDTLEKIDSIFGGMGQPVADMDGVNFYTFLDSNDEDNKLININGTPTLNLSDGIGATYNPSKQSGTGSDIKYSAFAFAEDFVGFLKSYAPETPIISIENQEFQIDKMFSLPDGNGSLEVGSTKDLFYIRPGAEQSGDLVIDYVVSSDGLDQEKQLIITDSTISKWRNDENRGVDFLEWPSPEPDQEGFCVYQKSQSLERCNKFDDYKVLSMDLESIRGTRYDDEAVYPDGTGNAFPGIQTILFTGDDLRVYFKDTTDHTYYEASAITTDFIARGGEALKYVEADNGGGDLNIIAQGLSLKPISPKPMTILLAETAPQEITIEFPESLSSFAQLPRFEVWNGIQTIPLAEEVDWNSERTIARVTTTVQGWTGGIQNHVRLLDFIFLPNSIQRYQPATDLIFTSSNLNENTPEFESLDNFSIPENQTVVGDVVAIDADGDLIGYVISGPDQESLSIDVYEGTLSFNEAPDYETRSTYRITVTATDGVNSSNQDILVLVTDVDDVAPIITSPASFSAPENQLNIGTATATDVDSESVSFEISGENLHIDSLGLITFTDAPDFETKSSYAGVITATDGINSSNQQISIMVIDENDSPEIGSADEFYALENQTSIGAVIATDADSDLLTYSIQAKQGVNNNNAFTQDSDSTLDETDFYVVSASSDQTVTLRIYDIDDQMKIILRNSGGVAQEELTYGKGSDTTINVLDYIAADGSTIDLELTNTNAGYTMGWELSVEGEVVYSNSCGQYDVSGCAGDSYSSGVVYAATIQLGIADDNISINPSTGQLTFDIAPDYETKDTYEITATVTDGENTTNQHITINIIDAVDEQPPVFTSDPDFEIYENTVDIGTVVVADNSDSLTFSVLDNNFLVSDIGELKFLSTPDYESKSTYTVDVFVNDGTYMVKQNVTVSVRNVLEDVISETFDISDGTNTEPPKLIASIQLDELNMAKNVYLSLTSFDSQGGDEFCSLGFIYQVFELEKQEGNTWSIQQDLRQNLSENCTYGASYYITEDNIVAESSPPQDGLHLRISDTELLTDTRQFAMRYSASQNVTIKNSRSSSDQPAFLLYKYDQNYPESCVISESSVSEIWGNAATWDAACFNSLAEVSEIDENFMSINFSILSDLPIESSFSILAAPKSTLDSSYDEFRAETNEVQINRGVKSSENYSNNEVISNGREYVVDLSAKIHKTTPNAALYLRSYMFAHNSNFASQPYLLYSSLGDFLDESQKYDSTPPVLNSLTVSDYTTTDKPGRDFKKFTVQLDNLTVGDEETSPIRDIWINTVDPSCRSVKFEIRDEADGLLDASESEYSATIPFLKQQLGAYQITQISVNDHALNASLYAQKTESTHPSIATIFDVGSTPIVSCPHFNNYAGDLDINVSVGETFVGDFIATVSDGDSVTYNLERFANSDFDIDSLVLSETGQVSFAESVTQDAVGGRFKVTASSSLNPDLSREITVEIFIVSD